MFAMFNLAQNTAPGHVHFKVEDDLFIALTDQPGISAAKYLARARCITVVEPRRFQIKWCGQLLRTACNIVAGRLSKKRKHITEERRVGKGCVSMGRSRCVSYHL